MHDTPVHPPPRRQPSILFAEDGLRPGWGLLLFVILFRIVSYPVHSAVAHLIQANDALPPASPLQTPRTTIVQEGASLLTVLLVTFTLSRVERRRLTVYGLGGSHRLKLAFKGLTSGLLSLSLLIAALYFTNFLHLDVRLLSAPSALRFALIWSIGFTLVAAFEETLIRGYLQYTLARALTEAIPGSTATHKYGFWSAALILSFFFGLGHSGNPGESPLGVVSAGLFGLVLCFSLARIGSLWWAIGFHAAWDWAESFLYGVPDSGSLVAGRLLATHPVGPPILSGGLTGPEGSIFILPTLVLATAILLLTTPNSPQSIAPDLQPEPALR